MSPQHTPAAASSLCICTLHSTSENDGGVHQEANLSLTMTQKQSVLEWSPLNCVVFLFFLPSRRDGSTLCFFAPVLETFQFGFIEVEAIPVPDRKAVVSSRETI